LYTFSFQCSSIIAGYFWVVMAGRAVTAAALTMPIGDFSTIVVRIIHG
jgi:hypothetical protein